MTMHNGLKIRWEKSREGSSPSARTRLRAALSFGCAGRSAKHEAWPAKRSENGLVGIAINYVYIIWSTSSPARTHHYAAGDFVPSRQLPGVIPVMRLKARMKAVSDS